MSEIMESAQRQMNEVEDIVIAKKTATTIPFDPDATEFPTRKQLPRIPGTPEGSAWVWGENDHLGRLNLLTPTRVKAAAAEIKLGEMVSINLPLNVPEVPAFHREPFKHEIKVLLEGRAYDDLYQLNTQSGTQWDGFRHFACLSDGVFYNNTRVDDIIGPKANDKCSINHWSEHGIAGRGILLDYRSYADEKGIQYDAHESHHITYDGLDQCGKHQGIDIRPQAQGGDIKIGDLLFIRSGFVKAYYNRSREERCERSSRDHEADLLNSFPFTGVAREEQIIDWLHDCYFSAVAGDSPTFEAWPNTQGRYLHEYMLPLWGCPIGEMVDLEKLATKCRELNRWTFFITSAPANVPGGIGSHVNGTAIF
ncbi:hypothetical protein MMC22_001675 [Lobaria immixta]|nr:hypothetical protein [Lobaria immixta]